MVSWVNEVGYARNKGQLKNLDNMDRGVFQNLRGRGDIKDVCFWYERPK